MAVQLPASVRRFLREPNPAVMATVTADGRPLAVATWYLLEASDLVLFSLTADRVRLAHIRRDPRIALDVLHPGDLAANLHPYRSVSLQLTAESITDDADFRDVDAVTRHYIDQPFPDHESPRVAVRARIDRFLLEGDFSDSSTAEQAGGARPAPTIAPWYSTDDPPRSDAPTVG